MKQCSYIVNRDLYGYNGVLCCITAMFLKIELDESCVNGVVWCGPVVSGYSINQ